MHTAHLKSQHLKTPNYHYHHHHFISDHENPSHVQWLVPFAALARSNPALTVLPPLPMTLPAAEAGTRMCVSSLTSSLGPKKFSSLSFP